jgi:hypothetical protein
LESDWIPKSGNFKHRKYKGEVRGINYTLDRINDAEIEVTLECDERLEEVQPYFDDLVIEIKNRYKRSLVSGLDKINDLPKKIQEAIREINKIDKLRHDGDLSIIEACSRKDVTSKATYYRLRDALAEGQYLDRLDYYDEYHKG